MYKYLKNIVEKNNKESMNRFLRYNLVPFELIIDEFKVKFRNELDKVFRPEDFIEGNAYNTLTLIALSGDYNSVVGILPIKDYNDKIIGITARGTFESDGNYPNYWINDNECVCHLISGNHKNNILLLTGKYPIYIFDKTRKNNQVFRGVFKLAEHLESSHQVRLVKTNSKKIKRKRSSR